MKRSSSAAILAEASGSLGNGMRTARLCVSLTSSTHGAESGSSGGCPPSTPLIEHHIPLRPGIRAHITLPEALTEKEAMRVARFAQSLAFSADQPAITAGEVPTE
jgi:hypothetical protein